MLTIIFWTILMALSGAVFTGSFGGMLKYRAGVEASTPTSVLNEQQAKAEQEVKSEEPRRTKITLGARGATPAHYRAFSLLQTRTNGARFDQALFSFRENAKRIKFEDDETIRAEALRLMDSFVLLADEFAPLSDNLAGAELKAVNDAMRDTVLRLDASLDGILDGSTRSTDGFRTALRFIETRYADEAPNLLSSI